MFRRSLRGLSCSLYTQSSQCHPADSRGCSSTQYILSAVCLAYALPHLEQKWSPESKYDAEHQR